MGSRLFKKSGTRLQNLIILALVLYLGMGVTLFSPLSATATVDTMANINAEAVVNTLPEPDAEAIVETAVENDQQTAADPISIGTKICSTSDYTLYKVTIEGGPTSPDNSTPINLSAHVYIPKGEKPEAGFPAILFIHSWALNELEYETKMMEFASEGYITICYTCRGWYGSPGQTQITGPQEITDLTKVVDWLIANTPVDPENIGATGISYGGGHSLLALKHEPRIKTIVPMSGWVDLYDALAPNHCLKIGWAGLLMGTGYTLTKPDSTMLDLLTAFLNNTNVDETFEKLAARSAITYINEINQRKVPVFIIQGMNDDLFTSGQMVDFYEAYQGPKKITLAQGVHASSEMPGLFTLPSFIWDDTRLWFDYWLKGQDNGIMNTPPVSIYQPWSNSQGTFNTWPVTQNKLALYPAKGLIRGNLNYNLSTIATSTTLLNSPFSLATSGITFLSPALKAHLGLHVVGATPLATSLDPSSTLFQTEPLKESVTVIGKPHVNLQVKTKEQLFQLNFLIYDVDKRGIARLVGNLPYSSYHLPGNAGEWRTVDLDMNVLSHKFEKGHRIRMVVSTSDIGYVKPVDGIFNVELRCGGKNGFSFILPVQ